MTSSEWINLVGHVAWPLVALAGLFYIWRSDALKQLIQISKSVDELTQKLDEVVQTEQRLRHTTDGFSTITETISRLGSDLADAKTGIEIIQDAVDHPTDAAKTAEPGGSVRKVEPKKLLNEIEFSWRQLVDALHDKFGDFDERSFAYTMRGFARRNRNGPKLSYEQADEVARLHSMIKSYRRRQKSVDEWIDTTVRNEFADSCSHLAKQINAL